MNQILTSRENQIIALIKQGKTNKQIAMALCIEETTVKAHLRRVFKKLNVASRLELAIKAYNEKLAN